MAYADLRKACTEKGLPANGTKEELVKRLDDSAGVTTPTEPETTEEDKDASTGAPEPKEKQTTAEKNTEKVIESLHRKDANIMKQHLDKQPKVRILVPFEPGVDPTIAAKIPFVVTLNGYRMEIKRGVWADVPEQVAQIIQDRLASEGMVGRENLITADPAKAVALG